MTKIRVIAIIVEKVEKQGIRLLQVTEVTIDYNEVTDFKQPLYTLLVAYVFHLKCMGQVAHIVA